VVDVEFITLKFASVRSLMRSLKNLGASNAAQSRARGLTGKGSWQKVLESYEHHRSDGRYPATWEVVYGTAFGPEEGQPVRTSQGEVASFSIEALRASARKERE
jgi:malonyl-CoA O-methyltransferase